MTMHTLTALFTSRDRAIAAASELRRRGLSSHITLSPTPAEAPDPNPERNGFWAWLDTLFGGSPDRLAYADAVARGEIILTAVVVETKVHETLRVLGHRLSTRVDRWRPSRRDKHMSGTDLEDGGASDSLLRPRSPIEASLTRMAQDLSTLPSHAMPEPDGDPIPPGQSRIWKVRVGMSVRGADGCEVGIVDAISREAVVLTPDALTGTRHRFPENWIETVDDGVVLKLSGPDAVLRWTDADRARPPQSEGRTSVGSNG